MTGQSGGQFEHVRELMESWNFQGRISSIPLNITNHGVDLDADSWVAEPFFERAIFVTKRGDPISKMTFKQWIHHHVLPKDLKFYHDEPPPDMEVIVTCREGNLVSNYRVFKWV